METKVLRRFKRHKAIKKKVLGTKERPRLGVFRSNTHIYASLIVDNQKRTLTSVSDKSLAGQKAQKLTKSEKAYLVGKRIAAVAEKLKIKKIVFDRSGYLYHGRVKALAQGAREGGLEF